MEGLDAKLQSDMLLKNPVPESVCAAYLNSVIESRRAGVQPVLDADGKGKGLYASQVFEAGQPIIMEEPLVAMQNVRNRSEALVCSRCLRFVGTIEAQLALVLRDHVADSGCPDRACVEALSAGGNTLPFSSRFPLPKPVPCRGDCTTNIYCSEACVQADWECNHAMLCTGPYSPLSAEQRKGAEAFLQHAVETNDIFILAAKLVCKVLLKASRDFNAMCEARDGDGPIPSEELRDDALKKAWLPFAVAQKALWWEAVAVPDDVEDEVQFRQDIQDLAAESLSLLQEAVYDSKFPGLFTLEVYGSIIGMFELNNIEIRFSLSLTNWPMGMSGILAPSPIEEYLIYIHMDHGDDIDPADRKAAREITGPLLDALRRTDFTCEGTGFYALQSCLNHSCCPNAHAMKRDDDLPATCVILAKEPIQQGDEVLISYIDESADFFSRAHELEDYGFICKCAKCLAESKG